MAKIDISFLLVSAVLPIHPHPLRRINQMAHQDVPLSYLSSLDDRRVFLVGAGAIDWAIYGQNRHFSFWMFPELPELVGRSPRCPRRHWRDFLGHIWPKSTFFLLMFRRPPRPCWTLVAPSSPAPT
ncbi:hypothetical protein B0H19DRAFT_1156340 [Mycena capillaripes]|nr:hypothetical protein B0H19DRAFT_1156340 [Mycena capillaripes]